MRNNLGRGVARIYANINRHKLGSVGKANQDLEMPKKDTKVTTLGYVSMVPLRK